MGLELSRRTGAFVPVALTCPTEELLRRMPLPERRARLNLNDPAALQATLDKHGVLPIPAGMLTLDTSQLTPRQAAQAIARHAGLA